MERIKLLRRRNGLDGTPGTMEFTIDGRDYKLNTLELPWNRNMRGESCIPEGSYDCVFAFSPHFQEHFYLVQNVQHRDGILFHRGNYASIIPGQQKDTDGCILVGIGEKEPTEIEQRRLNNSRSGIDVFHRALKSPDGTQRPFRLTIEWAKEKQEGENHA